MSSDDEVDEPVVINVVNSSSTTKKKSKKKKNGKRKEDSLWSSIGSNVKVEIDSVKGRKLIATSKIMAGDIILREMPVSVVSHPPSQRAICEVCCTILDKQLAVSDLFDRSFCSESCKLSASVLSGKSELWASLPAIATRSCCDVDLLRMALRLYLFLEQSPCSTDGTKSSFFTRNPSDERIRGTALALRALENHLDTQNPSWIKSLSGAIREILPYLDKDVAVDECNESTTESLLALAACVNVNAYGVTTPSQPNKSIGFCLLPVAGLLINHSCDPNAHYVFKRGAMEYRALKDIASGEEVTVSYVDVIEGTGKRRAILLQSKHFICHCDRCDSFDMAMERVQQGRPMAVLDLSGLGIDDDEVPAPKKAGKGNKSPAAAGPEQFNQGSSVKCFNSTLMMADAYLSGLDCQSCQAGVILCHSEGEEGFAGCLVCATSVEYATAAIAIQRIESSWTVLKESVQSGGALHVSAHIASLEIWLMANDPLAKQTIGEASREAERSKSSKKSKKKLPLQLHPYNAMVLEAYTMLSSLLSRSGSPSKVAVCIQRASRILSGILPFHHPELLGINEHLADVMHATGARRDAADLRDRCQCGRLLAYGPE